MASISPCRTESFKSHNTGTGTSALRYVFESDHASRKAIRPSS